MVLPNVGISVIQIMWFSSGLRGKWCDCI